MTEKENENRPPLRHPWVRDDLVSELGELSASDPRPGWDQARRQGLVAGVDEVFHFFFDDHDFDEAQIGWALFNQEEVEAVRQVKKSLDSLLTALGNVGDDEFARHPDWASVSSAAQHALAVLSREGQPGSPHGEDARPR